MDFIENKLGAHEISLKIIDDIHHGIICENLQLPTERELSEKYSVSRTVVREALLRVQLEGYLKSEPGKRARVCKPSIADIIMSAAVKLRNHLGDIDSIPQMEQIRLYLECGAIKEVAVKATNTQIAKIKARLEENYNAIGQPEFAETDRNFHHAIMDVVGNNIIMALYGEYIDDMLSHRPSWQEQKEHDRLVYREHHTIYEAILNEDAQLASDLMGAHLERSYRSRLLAPAPFIFD
ncbi:FadR/GntR family transcriptional regulator [Polycladidibacter stylochi]|uniref:FadR/GntR family transcriptional regulator n=1 Tax=Polycladidibacter stylochi TaxID=1807766 RepID=UPI00082BE497|nr:FCD domain-containing protein [Pseudovibrio stylochi]